MTNKEKMYLISEEDIKRIKFMFKTYRNAYNAIDDFLKSKIPVEIIADGVIGGIHYIPPNSVEIEFKIKPPIKITVGQVFEINKSGTLFWVQDKEE
ncbi:MAG: hypothetical protein PVJ67_04075 [Candidatus Pacearchaeota archaeon]|jgi:hypothetical protein